jgi:hypothetical protein
MLVLFQTVLRQILCGIRTNDMDGYECSDASKFLSRMKESNHDGTAATFIR